MLLAEAVRDGARSKPVRLWAAHPGPKLKLRPSSSWPSGRATRARPAAATARPAVHRTWGGGHATAWITVDPLPPR